MQRGYSTRGIRFLAVAFSIGLITAVANYQVAAADVFTDPVGFITLTANGTTLGGVGALSYLGLGMTQIPTNRGVISTISGTKITTSSVLPNNGFASGASGPLYFIEFLDGAHPGLLDDIVSNDTASVFTGTNDATAVSGATMYKIYPHWTVATVFGPNDESGLMGGGAIGSADNILIPLQSSQTFAKYYWFNGKGTVGWKDGSGNLVGNVRIFPDQGILISKATTTNLTIKLIGAVKLGPTLIPVGGTNTFLGNVYATSAMTLTNSKLYTGNAATGLTGGGSVGAADNVLIHQDGGTYAKYYWFNGKGTVGWKDISGNDASNVAISNGVSVLISLQTGHNGFNWAAAALY
ncbi:MAG: hypothetical protein ABSH14_15305 [Verrucomicrobiia bacterium]|jgi:uncharacterized protein (TIGR02597 family)